MIANVSPIDFGHALFVPEPESCLPQVSNLYIVRCVLKELSILLLLLCGQVFTEDSIRVCLELAALSGHRYATISFYTSVWHYHVTTVEKPDRLNVILESKPQCDQSWCGTN